MIVAQMDTFYKERVAWLEAAHDWRTRLDALPNERLSPAHKLVAWQVWSFLRGLRAPGDDGLARVHLADLAESTGMSDDTASKALAVLAKMGAFAKENRDVWTEEKTLGGKTKRSKQ